MAWQDRIRSSLQPKRIIGLSLLLEGEAGRRMHAIELQQKKQSILPGKSLLDLKGLEQLQEQLPPAAVALSLDGKGILYRQLEAASGESEGPMIQQWIPGADSKDFYVQLIQGKEGRRFISLIRKSLLDPLLEELAQAGYPIIALRLGPYALADLPMLLPTNEILLPGHRLQFSEGLLLRHETGHQDIPSSYSLAGNQVPPPLLTAFAAGLGYFSGANALTSEEFPAVRAQQEEQQQKQLFTWLLKGSLGFFFVLLLVNFLLFDGQFRKQQELTAQLATMEADFTHYEQLRQQYESSSQFLQQEGWKESSRTSYYADRIGASLPPGIQLNELHIFPPDKKQKKQTGQAPQYLLQQILLRGQSRESLLLNSWIQLLKDQEWVQDVRILNYEQEALRNAGAFEVSIQLK